MKSACRIALGLLLSLACLASAQAQLAQPGAQQPKTRADVRAQFKDWIAAGYDPNDRVSYPYNAMHASRIVAQRRDAQNGTPH